MEKDKFLQIRISQKRKEKFHRVKKAMKAESVTEMLERLVDKKEIELIKEGRL